MLKRFIIAACLFAVSLSAQVLTFKTVADLEAFSKIQTGNNKIFEPIALQYGLPLKFIISSKKYGMLSGFILNEQNDNLAFNLLKNRGGWKLSVSKIALKYKRNYPIFELNGTNGGLIKDKKEYELLTKAVDNFVSRHKQPPLKIYAVFEATLYDKDRFYSSDKALLIVNKSGYELYSLYSGELYDKNGVLLSENMPIMPVKFSRVSDFYSKSRYHPILKYFRAHEGVDLVAKYGEAVVSVMDGMILETGYSLNIGNYVKIAHKNGLETLYGHLSKINMSLTKGAFVKQGGLIGLVGSTGLSTGNHLHFGVKKNGVYIDPATVYKGVEMPANNEQALKSFILGIKNGVKKSFKHSGDSFGN